MSRNSKISASRKSPEFWTEFGLTGDSALQPTWLFSPVAWSLHSAGGRTFGRLSSKVIKKNYVNLDVFTFDAIFMMSYCPVWFACVIKTKLGGN